MLGPALTGEIIPMHFWLLNISSAFIDPVLFCISQTRAAARLTQQVVDHMLNRTGPFSQEILSPDKTIVDRFKSCCFFSRERLCASSCTESSVFIVLQSRSDPAHSVCSVTRWILRATTADPLTGIQPINLANNICYKGDQLRSESLFGLYLRLRLCKQNSVYNSSDSRRATVETPLLSAACIPLTASADVESNLKYIVRKFSRSCSGGKAEMGDVGEDYASHVSNNTSSK